MFSSPPSRAVRIGAVFLIALVFTGCHSINRTAAQARIPAGIVIFTFDDGPNAHGDTTARVLEVLKKYDIRAMFALLGENIAYNPELARRIHNEGHYIINHGYSERHAVHMDPRRFYTNLVQGQTAITAALGHDAPLLYRPHGGFYRKQHWRIWEERHYAMIPGTARAYDAVLTGRDREKVIDRIVKAVDAQNGGIILLHDARDSHTRMETRLAKDPGGMFNRSWIPDTVEEIIIILQAKGYTLRGFDIASVLQIPQDNIYNPY
ncbi:MAG: polysaccharide deacetylase family protein [Treponema sp.]|nr:polysaccharide deacetylase family protein [Treponema sp.]